ncbi:hypothetical protein [Enterococcus devriesei]|uniref:hypothetical protein n=1 Tax=Enterococcus devriesei TaxID=319970 RepID=UPI0036D2FB67
MRIFEEIQGLDSQQWSRLWLRCLDRAIPLNRIDTMTILDVASIVPLPNMEEVLVFSSESTYHCSNDSLKTMIALETSHQFPKINENGFLCTKDTPLPRVSPLYLLFSTGKEANSLWINPLKIHHLYSVNHSLYAEMLEGPNLALPIKLEQFLSYAEQALCLFLSLRLVDLLENMDTPFIVSLMDRPLLRQVLRKESSRTNSFQI